VGALAAAPLLGGRAAASTGAGQRPRVRPGADAAQAGDWSVFRGRRIGVITTPTGVVQDTLGSIVDAMVASGKVEVGAVFGPEHGFRGTAQAGSSEDTYVDERTGVTVYDAYGATAAKFQQLYTDSKVDTVVFDIQDVGARFYTYIWTMYAAMTAAAKAGLSFIVLDRPNPIGGRAQGPVLRDGFTSGVGEDKIAQAHGMTAGEIARFFDGEFLPAVAGRRLEELRVVRMRGWRADMLYPDTGLPWILPSPNMPSPTTALLYPGTCLFEATNLSEGRGTTLPFELIGAPYIDYRWAADLTRRRLTGVRFREAYFTPTFSKNADLVCGGVQVHVTDAERVDAITVATHMLVSLRDLYDAFDWRLVGGVSDQGRWLDLLTGSDRFRTQFEAGASAPAIVAAWRRELAAFDRSRQPYLLYPRES
ncbi:MAG: DUF1343 domain-containing protein, partial [Propionibacteriaceae bacterium]